MSAAPPLVGDEHMGMYVYCKSHLGPHSTGWCTVPATDKIALKAMSFASAVIEVRAMGLRIYGDPK